MCLLFRTKYQISFFIHRREREEEREREREESDDDDDDERMRTEDQNQKRERGDDDVENNNNNKIKTVFSRVHVYDNENKRRIQNDWGRDPFFLGDAESVRERNFKRASGGEYERKRLGD